MKKIVFIFIIFALTLAFMPTTPAAAESEETVHFIMSVRWGNVQGEVTNRERTDFGGSIFADSEGIVSVVNVLKFEDHGTYADKIISKNDLIAWNSFIFGHWDGLQVAVSAPASSTVSISTNAGNLVKTAQELFSATGEIVEDLGEGREIVVNTHPIGRRHYMAYVYWGGGEPLIAKDFDGSLTLGDGATMRVVKTLRFEPRDEVISEDTKSVSWDSRIGGGRDGLMVKFTIDKSPPMNIPLTAAFSSADTTWSNQFSLLDLLHQRHTEEPITMTDGSSGYEFTFAIAKRPNHKLVKGKSGNKVYLLEDDMKRWIPSEAVFEGQELDWDEILVLEDVEMETYPDGDHVTYPDGTIIKGSGADVFVVSEERVRPVKSEKAFERLGYEWDKIVPVADEDLEKFKVGTDLVETSDYPEGTLMQAEGTKGVYLIEGGKKKPITSSKVFNERRYDWDRVVKTAPVKVDSYETSTAVTYPDGTAIKGTDNKVYVIDKGEAKHVETEEDFTSGGLEWDKVVPVDDSEIKSMESNNKFITE